MHGRPNKVLQQTAAAMLVSWNCKARSTAAAAAICRSFGSKVCLSGGRRMATWLRTSLAEEPASGKVAPALLAVAVLCHVLPWEWQVAGTFDARAFSGFRSSPYGLASAVLAGAAAFCLLFLAAASVASMPGRVLRGVGWLLAVGALVCQGLAFVPRERYFPFANGQIVYEVSPSWGLYVTTGLTALGLVFAVLRGFEGKRPPNQPLQQTGPA
jgi:hypothetical protein